MNGPHETLLAQLGLPDGASPREIKHAYRRLVRDSHPDTHQRDEAAAERLRAVVAAYHALAERAPAKCAPPTTSSARAAEEAGSGQAAESARAQLGVRIRAGRRPAAGLGSLARPPLRWSATSWTPTARGDTRGATR